MINNVETPESEGWWIVRLANELMTRRARIQPLWDRHKGDSPLPELGSPGAARNRERVWKAFQRKARMNLAELVTRTVAERLEPLGCRVETDQDLIDAVAVATGTARQVGSPLRGVPGDATNALARRIWASNSMDIQASEVIEKMLVMGESYTITGPPRDGVKGALPIITAEDPRWVITEQDPEMPQRVVMGLKLYYDPIAQRDVGWLYPPGRAIKFERTADSVRGTSCLDVARRRFRFDPRQWEITDERDLSAQIGDRCAVSRFANHDSEGEFENHLDHLDRVNHMLLQRIVIATLQAFRQRAAKGIPTKDPKTGKEIDYSDIFTNDPGALWLLPATAELWESGQVDLTPLLTSVKDDIRDLAAVLRMPVQHFMPDAANASAEGASSAKEGLIFRAKDRRNRLSTGFADAMSLAFGYLPGADGDDPLTITTLWAPIERFSLTERYSAAAQANGIVPWESIMVDVLQYEPDDLPRLRAQRADDLIFAPQSPATTGGGAGGSGTRDQPAGGAGSAGGSSGSTSSGAGSGDAGDSGTGT